MSKVYLIIVLLFLSILLSGCMVVHESNTKSITEEKNLNLGETDKIVIESSSSDINFIQEEREDIYVRLETYEDGPYLNIKEGKTLTIEAKKDPGIKPIQINYSSKLYVYVPKEFTSDIEISNSSGNVKINDILLNNIDLDISSGSVNGNNIVVGTCKVNISSGSVNIDNMVCEDFDVDLTSGNLNLKKFTGEINGHSSSGSSTIGLAKLSGDIKFTANSGNIDLIIDEEDVDARFDLSTSSGNIKINYDFISYDKDKNKVKFDIGEGTYQIDLHTSSGNITVR